MDTPKRWYADQTNQQDMNGVRAHEAPPEQLVAADLQALKERLTVILQPESHGALTADEQDLLMQFTLFPDPVAQVIARYRA